MRFSMKIWYLITM